MKQGINNKQYVLSFVFNDKEPILEDELRIVLSNKKYNLENTFKLKQGPFSVKNMKVASKNNCDIVYNSDQGSLFVAGKNWNNVNEEFPKLKTILSDELDIDMDEMIKSFELISDNQIFTKKKPTEIIDNYYNKCNATKFDTIFDEECAYHMIRVVPKGKNRRSANWYDLVIEPFSVHSYRVRLVYRNKNVDKVQKIASDIETKLSAIITLIEGGVQ